MKGWLGWLMLITTIAMAGCSPILCKRIEVLHEGHNVSLENQKVGVGWVQRRVLQGKPRTSKKVWELKLALPDSDNEAFLHKGDTLHLGTIDWKVICFVKGKPRNRAYVKRLGPIARNR